MFEPEPNMIRGLGSVKSLNLNLNGGLGLGSELGIVTGNPGVFQGYPYPYLRKPTPAPKGTGFDGLG